MIDIVDGWLPWHEAVDGFEAATLVRAIIGGPA